MMPSRRGFIKSTLGGSAAVGLVAPVLAQVSDESGKTSTKIRPNAALGAAESGPVSILTKDDPLSQQIVHDPGSDFMVDVLKAAGVRYVAAMAGSTFRGLQESIINYAGNKNPEFIVCMHEEVSAAMAHGYAKVSGEPMACLVHSNVGLQHASMAIYNAWCDRAPLVVIIANIQDATQRRPGVEWLHTQSDVSALVRDFTKWDDIPASLQHFAESFMRAREIAMTPPYGPVVIVADGELQEKMIADRATLEIPKRAPVTPPSAPQQALDRLAGMLVAAERPVLVVDRLARSQEGVDLLVRLAELLNAPVVDLAGRMNFPTNHYLYQTGRQRTLISSADLIVGFELTDLYGVIHSYADLTERTARRVAPANSIIVNIGASLGFTHGNVQDLQRYNPADLTLAADAQASLPGLIAAIERALTPERREAILARAAGFKTDFAEMRSADAELAAIGWSASPIATARLLMELWEQVKALDWALVSGTMLSGGWPQRLWDITKYHQFIGDSGGYGVGYNAPASVGAALAHRDAGRIAISIQGDGDLMCLPSTLWTAAHHELPLLMIMHNNRAWHQETMHLQRMANRRDRGADRWTIGTVIREPLIDYALLAKSMGVWAEGPITDPSMLGPAIARALAIVKSGKPALLDVVTQPR